LGDFELKIFEQEFFAKYISQTAVIYKLQVYKKAYSSGDQELFFWKETKKNLLLPWPNTVSQFYYQSFFREFYFH
jgi:hypothetical protein